MIKPIVYQGREIGFLQTFKNTPDLYAPARIYRRGRPGELVAYLASPRMAQKWGIRRGEISGNGYPYVIGGMAEAVQALLPRATVARAA